MQSLIALSYPTVLLITETSRECGELQAARLRAKTGEATARGVTHRQPNSTYKVIGDCILW